MKSRMDLPFGFEEEQPGTWSAVRHIENLREAAAEQPDAGEFSDDALMAEIERLQQVSEDADWRIEGLLAAMRLRLITRAMGGEQP